MHADLLADIPRLYSRADYVSVPRLIEAQELCAVSGRAPELLDENAWNWIGVGRAHEVIPDGAESLPDDHLQGNQNQTTITIHEAEPPHNALTCAIHAARTP